MEQVRVERDLSWQQISEMMSVNYVTLNGWVNNRHEPLLSALQKFCKAFPEVNLQVFFDEDAQLYHPEYNPETALSHFYGPFTSAVHQMRQLADDAQKLHKELFPNSQAFEPKPVKQPKV